MSFERISEKILLSVCIVNWNTKDLLRQCLSSVLRNVGISGYEILVVDNDSQDGTGMMIQNEFPSITFVQNKVNVGFSRANNQMLQMAKGKYALLLNPDVMLLEFAVPILIDFMERNEMAGACGPRLLNEDGSYQRSVLSFPTLKHELWNHLKHDFLPTSFLIERCGNLLRRSSLQRVAPPFSDVQTVDAVVGACFMVRRRIYEEVGLMEEAYFLFSEENDWCWRMKVRNWRVYHIPQARVIHLGQQCINQMDSFTVEYNFIISRYQFFVKNRSKISSTVLKVMHLSFFWMALASESLLGLANSGSNHEQKREFYRKILRTLRNVKIDKT